MYFINVNIMDLKMTDW